MGGAKLGRIVVTGASTGIGRACALRLAHRGYTVFAGVRNPADGEAIRSSSPDNIRPVLLDVTRADSITAARAVVGDEPLAGLVNNAGIAVTGPIEMVPLQAWRDQFEVNVFGLVAVTKAFLPLLRQGRGCIVNIGSIAGRSALPGTAPYDASKFAVEAITDALRMELNACGVRVAVIEPGAVATPAWQKNLTDAEALRCQAAPGMSERYAGLLAALQREAAESARKAIAADTVAKVVERAMTARLPRTRYPIGPDAWFLLGMNLLPDRWRDRLILSRLQTE